MFKKNESIKYNLFISLFILSSTIFTIALIVTIGMTTSSLIKTTNTSLYISTLSSSDTLQLYASELEDSAKKIAINESILLSEDKDLISNYLRECNSISPNSIQNIYFYYKGTMYSSIQTLYDIYGNPYLKEILPSEYSNTIFWESPYSTLISPNTMPVVYCVGDSDDYGVLIIDFNLSSILDHFEEIYAKDNLDYIIISQNPYTILSTSLSNDIPNSNVPSLVSDLSSLKFPIDEPLPYTYDGTSYDIFYTVSHRNFQFYILSENKIYEIITPVIFIGVLTLLAIIFVLLLLSLYIANQITKPITQLTEELKIAHGTQEFPTSIENTYSGEVFNLVESYNSLVLQISTLAHEKESEIIEKNKYELQMLQHQIGPHFLHNTLICIGSLAKQHKHEEVVLTLKSLLALLSYSFDNSNDTVSLRDELKYLENFIHIFRTRYEQTIDFHMNIPDELLDYQIPKLLLQPIVENAIYHGILPKEIDGIIDISVCKNINYICIKIKDNGIGMRNIPEQVGKHNSNMHSGLSVGLYNVIQRVHLYYGTLGNVTIFAKSGNGTTVTFELPCT